MDEESIKIVVAELDRVLVGRSPGKILQLDSATFIIDFRLRDQGALLLGLHPAQSRLHLVRRRLRELEKQSAPLSQFGLTLRKHLSNTQLASVRKERADRVVRFEFSGEDELRREKQFTLIAQLTGRSANLFIVDDDDRITQSARAKRLPGQRAGERYEPPKTAEPIRENKSELFDWMNSGRFESPSEAAEKFYEAARETDVFNEQAASVRARLRNELSRRKKLRKNLEADLQSHAEAERQKRIGDLLLANLSTAKRSGNRVVLIDYFDAKAPSVEIEIDENRSMTEEASRRHLLYSRSKRAVAQIETRIKTVSDEIAALTAQQIEVDEIISARDQAALDGLYQSERRSPSPAARARESKRVPGTRRYISSEGFEILIGRAAKDNDHLTFKVARPNDLWLHSADYPGSHVVVRNPTRKDLPHHTIIEAAQLAAHFSQANKNAKVDVHYTQRKFLSKPKAAAPGLVRMSRFKTITVEPREVLTRLSS